METKFNFNSQICTTREQSERLLALGLKKETADMTWQNFAMTEEYEDWKAVVVEEWDDWCSADIPAWSLHRLLELSPELVKQETPYFTKDGNVELVNGDGIVTKAWGGKSLYDALIYFFQWLIKEGYFNKEYLV